MRPERKGTGFRSGQEGGIFGDSIDSVEHESGDYLFPLKEGVITREHLRGTIGDILLKKIPGRESDDQITVFEALGLAVEDIAAAKYLYDRVTEND